MRVHLKGINSITRTLADGSRKTYSYAWKGGPPLRGEPGTPDFQQSYNEAIAARTSARFPSLPGGIIKRKGQNPNAVCPLIGVYLLLLNGQIVYVGSSTKMPERVNGHRTNGRPFDQVFYIATTADEREALERTLIKAIDPPQNRQHREARAPVRRDREGAR
jgi:hypothetical protein